MQPTLPPDVARCRPVCNTLLRETCARFVVAIPDRFASVVDGRKEWPAQPCAGYLPASEHMQPQRPERAVRPAIGSDE